MRADSRQEGVGLVDVLAAAGAEADVVQPNRPLLEPLPSVRWRRRLDAEPGAPADAIVCLRGIGDTGQAHEGQQLAVEGASGGEVAGGDEGVRDAVDFHGWGSSACISSRA